MKATFEAPARRRRSHGAKTVEDLFGLYPLAKAGGAKVRSFAPALLGESGGD